MKLKSEIARPSVYATLAPNQVYTVFGAAWAGETEVAEIAVSTDGGQTWAEAEFLDPVQRYAWRRWKFDWLTPKKPDNTPCWPVPQMPKATHSLINMTGTTAPM
jgi:hypothetical protein